MRRTCRCMEMAAITCYQSTWSHLVDQKALDTSLVCFRIGLRSSSRFLSLKLFLYTGRNDVTISQTWEFLTPVYLCLLVCNFAVKLAFVPNLLAIVFAIKVWCQFHPHSWSVYIQLYHMYKGSLSFKGSFTKLLNVFFASIFRYRCYDRSRTYVVMCNADGKMFGEMFDFNTLSCLNCFVQRVWGVYKMVVEIPKGWGGYFSGQKMEIPERRGDLTWNSLRGGGMDIFWNYTLPL